MTVLTEEKINECPKGEKKKIYPLNKNLFGPGPEFF
jgi:hypothetical protein